MKGVDKYVETAAARGKPMNDTRDGWKYLADMYAIGMIQQEEEIQEIIVDGVKPMLINEEDFLCPPEIVDIQSSPLYKHNNNKSYGK